MKCDLTGKVSLVTGAARGIGQAIADRLAANGSQVVYSDRDAAEVQAAAGRVPGARALRLDVTQPRRSPPPSPKSSSRLAGSTCWSTTPASILWPIECRSINFRVRSGTASWPSI